MRSWLPANVHWPFTPGREPIRALVFVVGQRIRIGHPAVLTQPVEVQAFRVLVEEVRARHDRVQAERGRRRPPELAVDVRGVECGVIPIAVARVARHRHAVVHVARRATGLGERLPEAVPSDVDDRGARCRAVRRAVGRRDVDDSTCRAAAVHRRRRASEHLDAVDREPVHVEQIRREPGRIVERQPVLQHLDAADAGLWGRVGSARLSLGAALYYYQRS